MKVSSVVFQIFVFNFLGFLAIVVAAVAYGQELDPERLKQFFGDDKLMQVAAKYHDDSRVKELLTSQLQSGGPEALKERSFRKKLSRRLRYLSKKDRKSRSRNVSKRKKRKNSPEKKYKYSFQRDNESFAVSRRSGRGRGTSSAPGGGGQFSAALLGGKKYFARASVQSVSTSGGQDAIGSSLIGGGGGRGAGASSLGGAPGAGGSSPAGGEGGPSSLDAGSGGFASLPGTQFSVNGGYFLSRQTIFNFNLIHTQIDQNAVNLSSVIPEQASAFGIETPTIESMTILFGGATFTLEDNWRMSLNLSYIAGLEGITGLADQAPTGVSLADDEAAAQQPGGVTATLGFTKSLGRAISYGVSQPYGLDAGALQDGSVFTSYSNSPRSGHGIRLLASATYPISEASRNDGKLTTLNASVTPNYRLGKLNVSFKGSASYSIYNGLTEDQSASSSSSQPLAATSGACVEPTSGQVIPQDQLDQLNGGVCPFESGSSSGSATGSASLASSLPGSGDDAAVVEVSGGVTGSYKASKDLQVSAGISGSFSSKRDDSTSSSAKTTLINVRYSLSSGVVISGAYDYNYVQSSTESYEEPTYTTVTAGLSYQF